MSEFSHLGTFAHGLSMIFDLDELSVQKCPSVSTHSCSSAFLKWGLTLRNFMPPKRRFWKTKQKPKCGFSIDF